MAELSCHLLEQPLPERRIALDGPGLVAWAARHRQPRYAPDVRAAPDYSADAFIPDTVAEAVVPVMAREPMGAEMP